MNQISSHKRIELRGLFVFIRKGLKNLVNVDCLLTKYRILTN